MSILGNRVLRKEDPKFLTVGGTYVDDVRDERLTGAAYVTFVRDQVGSDEGADAVHVGDGGARRGDGGRDPRDQVAQVSVDAADLGEHVTAQGLALNR